MTSRPATSLTHAVRTPKRPRTVQERPRLRRTSRSWRRVEVMKSRDLDGHLLLPEHIQPLFEAAIRDCRESGADSCSVEMLTAALRVAGVGLNDRLVDSSVQEEWDPQDTTLLSYTPLHILAAFDAADT